MSDIKQLQEQSSSSGEQAPAVEVVAVAASSDDSPVDVPCEALTCLGDDLQDPLMMEVEAVPENRIVRLSATTVSLVKAARDIGSSSQHESIVVMGKYGVRRNYNCSNLRSEDNYTPSHVSVTLLNAKHRNRIVLWQSSNRNHNMQQDVQNQQHTVKPSFDPLGLTFAENVGNLSVASLETTSASLPWSQSMVSVGDRLVSINHQSVAGLTPLQARDKLYNALLRVPSPIGDESSAPMTTTLVFAKASGSPDHVASTVEKATPESKLGLKFVGLATERTLRISDLGSGTPLASSCLTHTKDNIVAVNGQTVEDIWQQSASTGLSLTKSAVRIMAASPRYVTLLTQKQSDAAVALAAETTPASFWFGNPFVVSQ